MVDETVERRFRAEVQEEADFEARGAEIVVQLACGGPVQLVCGLRLHHQSVVHQHVQSLHAELVALVHDAHADLAGDLVAARAELVGQGAETTEIQVYSEDGLRPRREGESLDNVEFVYFDDPDGNGWTVQQISSRG